MSVLNRVFGFGRSNRRRRYAAEMCLESLESRCLLSSLQIEDKILATASVSAKDVSVPAASAKTTWNKDGSMSPAGNIPGTTVLQVNSSSTIGQAHVIVSSTPGTKSAMTILVQGLVTISNGTARYEVGTGIRGGDPISVLLAPQDSEAEGDAVRVTLETFRNHIGGGVAQGQFEIGYAYNGEAVSDKGSLSDLGTAKWTFDAELGETFDVSLYLQGSKTSSSFTNALLEQAGLTIRVEPIIPDIVINDAITNLNATAGAGNFRKIPIKYTVTNTSVEFEIGFAVYQSSDMNWDSSDTRINADIISASGQTPTIKRKEGTYSSDSLALKSTVTMQYSKRFLIVMADPDKKIKESNERNNTMFVIPLIPENQPAAFLSNGAFAMYQNASKEDTVVGAIAGRISRNTPDFTDILQDVSSTWKNAGGTFKDEEPLPYRGDDHLMNKSLAGPLGSLIKIIKETEKQKRFSMSSLRINEAFDEQMEHPRIASLHYEGRSIDFSGTGDRAKQLAGLTLLAGFRWNVNETPSNGTQHVHLSHTGTKATLSITNLLKSLTWGNTKDLITDSRFNELKAVLTTALAAAGNQSLSTTVRASKVKTALNSFIAAIPDNAPAGFVTQMASSLSTQPAQKTWIHQLLKRNAAIVLNDIELWV